MQPKMTTAPFLTFLRNGNNRPCGNGNERQNGTHKKFIMVQIQEPTGAKSEAYKAGFKNICEIGKERIRKAAALIKKTYPGASFDSGFRVLKLDTSNMQQVWYTPTEYIAKDLLN